MAFGSFASALGGGSLGNLFVRLLADSSHLLRGMDQAERRVAAGSKTMTRQLGLLASAASAAFIGVGVSAVRAFSDFDKAMTNSTSIMEGVSQDMRKELEETARQLSTQSTNSATQLAEAYSFLASSGLNVEQSQKALAVVDRFSIAGRFDLAKATDLLATAQGALGLRTDDTTQNMINMQRVSDVLVKANNIAIGTVEDFAEALTNRAAGALRLVNKDVEEGVAVLAAFAKAGIKGATAGEQLHIVMRDLQRTAIKHRQAFKDAGVEVFNSAGQMNHMADIIGDLENKLAGMSDEQKRVELKLLGFQDKSLGSMLAIMGFSKEIRQFDTDLRKAGGTTEEVSDKVLTSFSAQLTITKNLVTGLKISIGEELAPVLLMLNGMFKDWIKSSDDLNKSNDHWTKNIAPAFLTIIGMIGDAFQGWQLIIKTLQFGFSDFALTVNKVWDFVLDKIVKVIAKMGKILLRFQEDFPGVTDILGGPSGFNVAPLMKQLHEIQTTAGEDLEGLKKVVEQNQKELNDIVNKAPFSETLRKKFENAARDAGPPLKATVKLVEDSTNQILHLLNLGEGAIRQDQFTPGMASSTIGRIKEEDAAMESLAPRKNSKTGKIKGGAFDDPKATLTIQLQDEIKEVKKWQKELEDLGDLEVEGFEEVQAEKLKMLEDYNKRVRLLQEEQAKLVFNTSSEIFGDLATMTKEFAGEQSGIYKAMFAASKAFAIAEATVKIAQGIANASSLSWPANLVAMASVVAATASIVSNIKSVQLEFGGGREGGGLVSAGKSFLVGEGGPEMFVPRTGGNIIPNDELGGNNVRVEINNFTDGTATVSERDDNGERVIEVTIQRAKREIASEIRDGRGEVTRSMESSFGLRRGK